MSPIKEMASVVSWPDYVRSSAREGDKEMFKKTMSIRNKLLIVFISITLLAVVGTAFSSFRAMVPPLRQSAMSNLKSMIDQFYKYKRRIKRVLLRRFQEKFAISSLVSLLQTAADGVWFDLEMAQESMFKLFSSASFSIIDNSIEGISPALYDLIMGYDR